MFDVTLTVRTEMGLNVLVQSLLDDIPNVGEVATLLACAEVIEASYPITHF